MNYEEKYYNEMMKLEKMFWAMIMLLVVCSVISISLVAYMSIKPTTPEYVYVEPDVIIDLNDISEPIPMATSYEIPTAEPVTIEVEMEEVMVDDVCCFTSKSYINNKGVETLTSEIEINVTELPIYETFEIPTWDYKERIKDVEIIWDFLVNQQNVHPNVAAGIIGCIYHEGTFGEQQSTHEFICSIEDARAWLDPSAKSTGYGLAQWTFDDRRELLLKYYEEAFIIYPDDSYKASVVAELCCLVEELKGYNVFGDLSKVRSVEDATGRMAKLYECYKGCEDDWKKSNGSYQIASNDKSATKRLATAYDVYYYFMED